MNKRLNIFWCLAAAAVCAVGCDDSDAEYDPGIRFSRTGDVTLVAGIENCATRASIVATGEARWQREDAIGVVCEDGTMVTFPLDGTGETRRAFFSGTIPQGKRMGAYALHPATASMTGDVLKASLPVETTPSTSGSCSVMAARIDDSAEIDFRQLVSYVSLQIENVSDDAATIVLKADKNLSGEFSARLPEAFETGLEATGDGEQGLVVALPEKHGTTVTVVFPLPVGEYRSLVAASCNAEGKELVAEECLATPLRADRGLLRSVQVTLPKVSNEKPQIEGTILVAGIYWAPGNLQYFEGATGEGFQTDWRLAPDQWHYVNCENAAASGKAVTFKPTSYQPQYDHFNWGGIAAPFDKAAESSAVAAVGTDISGKMYTSQDCTAVTTDFAAAKYGDLAFWASKGKFRLPTQAEMQKLVDEASSQYGSYEVASGKFVTGILFTNPAEGEQPVHNDTEVTFTDEDMARGLFLPKAGRRYNSTEYTVNVQGTQGVYWTSESITGDKADQPCYGAVFSIQSAAIKYPYWNKAFNATAGFSIRPVYIEK